MTSGADDTVGGSLTAALKDAVKTAPLMLPPLWGLPDGEWRDLMDVAAGRLLTEKGFTVVLSADPGSDRGQRLSNAEGTFLIDVADLD